MSKQSELQLTTSFTGPGCLSWPGFTGSKTERKSTVNSGSGIGTPQQVIADTFLTINENINGYTSTEKLMPASERFQSIKHKMKGKGFQVPNKCPYCKGFHTTIELTPLAPWLRFNYQACQNCKVNRHKTEQGEGYEPYGRTKRRAVNG